MLSQNFTFRSFVFEWLQNQTIPPRGGGGVVTLIGAVSRAATVVKIFDRQKMALTA